MNAKPTIRLVMLTMAAMSLGACNWFYGKSRTLQADSWIKRQSEQKDYGRTQLAEGRKALDRRDDIAAIIAFSNVQRIPQFAAEAHNGMAIGYARVGRPDLAERYFRQAILEAPDEPRFVNNLALLHRNAQHGTNGSMALAQTSAQPKAAAADDTSRDIMPGIRIERPHTRLVRSGDGEVTLTTQPLPGEARQVRMTRADR